MLSRPKGSLSPSQIHTARRCPRKWGFRSLLDLPSPSSLAQQFGSDVHKHLEQWLRYGSAPDQSLKSGRLATEGIPFLPRPGQCLVEQECVLWLRNVPFYMFIDCLEPICLDDKVGMRVTDHKTIGNTSYALTSEDLKTDPQSVLYSLWAWANFRVDFVEARWLYYPKSGGNVFERKFTFWPENLALAEATLFPEVEILYSLRQKRDQLNVDLVNRFPCNPRSCGFARCDYLQYCKIGENHV